MQLYLTLHHLYVTPPPGVCCCRSGSSSFGQAMPQGQIYIAHPKASKKLTNQENGHYAFFNPNSTILLGARKLSVNQATLKPTEPKLQLGLCNKTELGESVTFWANYCLISSNLQCIYRKSTVYIIIFREQ